MGHGLFSWEWETAGDCGKFAAPRKALCFPVRWQSLHARASATSHHVHPPRRTVISTLKIKRTHGSAPGALECGGKRQRHAAFGGDFRAGNDEASAASSFLAPASPKRGRAYACHRTPKVPAPQPTHGFERPLFGIIPSFTTKRTLLKREFHRRCREPTERGGMIPIGGFPESAVTFFPVIPVTRRRQESLYL